MDRIAITGGNKLFGEIPISGAKNAALPLMTACLLTDEPLSLSNIPHLADISLLAELLAQLGVDVTLTATGAEGAAGRVMRLTAKTITSTHAPYDLVRKMRASFLVLGPLLARFGHAEVSLPGGCAIGTRPVDLHLMGLEAMGAVIALKDGYVHAQAPQGLKGAHVRFPVVSVGATEHLMMAAALADGTTVLENAAREPEIEDLARCLIAMGSTIDGINTDTLTITGRARLHGAHHRVVADRIETGTYLMAVGVAGGDVELIDGRADHLDAVIHQLRRVGMTIETTNRGLKASRNGAGLEAADMITAPYPGFPTDLQAQYMALMCAAKGSAEITETIFENRFMHAPELGRMGADISVHGQAATVKGVAQLKGAPVMATDLRASVSLVLAGLAAEGETIVNRVYHLDRGFERLEEKLGACGADIRRLKG